MTRSWDTQPWAESYRRALLEMNTADMPGKIATARSAIWNRIAEVGRSKVHERETIALYDSLRMLQLLEGESTST